MPGLALANTLHSFHKDMTMTHTPMNSIKRLQPFFFFVVVALLSPVQAEAATPPFKAPAGAQVSYSSQPNFSLWTIYSPDYSATAVVARIKLPKQYWRGKAFERYVNSSFKDNQTWANYGIKVRARWKNGAYTLQGTSGNYRIYAKGKISNKGFYSYSWAVGPKGADATDALEKMVKAIK